MVTETLSPHVDSLIERLDALSRRATVDELQDWLTHAEVALDDLLFFGPDFLAQRLAFAFPPASLKG